MSNKTLISLVLILFYSFSSCNDGNLFDSIPGRYNVEVVVVNRKWVYPKATEKVDGYMEYFHKQLISTISDSMCCHQPSKVPLCPWIYAIDNIQLFKKDGKYYLRNDVDNNDPFYMTLSHLEFESSKKRLSFEGNHHFSRLKYVTSLLRDGDPTNDPIDYPSTFRIFYISLNQTDKNVLKGEWFIADAKQCDGTHLGQEFHNGEYAKIKLTKVE